MMNKEKTLFIFEGASSEDKYVEKLERNFLGEKHAIKCVFDAEIYQLYRAIKNEDGFPIDIVSLLKERTAENAEILKDYTRDSFAYVYLFFDYDGHVTRLQEIDSVAVDRINRYLKALRFLRMSSGIR